MKQALLFLVLVLLQIPVIVLICMPVILVRAIREKGHFKDSVKHDVKRVIYWWLDHAPGG